MIRPLLGFLFLVFYPLFSYAQTYSHKNGIKAQANLANNEQDLYIQWENDPLATDYFLYRRNFGAGSWGPILATISGNQNGFTDTTVLIGQVYEYKILRNAATQGYGYLCAAIDSDIDYNPGIMLMVLDDYFLPSLQLEVQSLIDDIEADGWFVHLIQVNRNQTPTDVKNLITAEYNANPNSVKAVLLCGHVPVPYSGDLNPDGHPDHLGAWPADVYYADMNGSWTDNTVNNATASDPRNHNIPGDGKFDPYLVQSNAELEISRIDFFNLPIFNQTETQLMSAYLSKLHEFKTRIYVPEDTAIVEDNFLGLSEGFAGSGYISLSPIVGINQVNDGDYSGLSSSDVLWSYGTGPGSYNSASGIVTCVDFSNTAYRSTFTMIFGSYFGDWDSQNNLLRSALASGRILCSSWSGRPYLYYHSMGIGNRIGHCIKSSQNNTSAYLASTLGTFQRWVHIAQMGDLSLRSHYLDLPSNLSSNVLGDGSVQLNWLAPLNAVDGYYVYRRDGNFTGFVESWNLLTPTPLTATNYLDNSLVLGGPYEYMVRSASKQTTGSGRYWNQSLGIRTECISTVSMTQNQPILSQVKPNPFLNTISITCEPFTSVFVYNFDGKLIFTESSASTDWNINTTNWKSGVYFLRMGNRTIKLIKA